MSVSYKFRWAMLSTILLHGGSVLVAQSAASQRSGSPFTKVLSVNGTPELDIFTNSGEIEIRAGAAERVEVTGVVRVRPYTKNVDAEKVSRELASKPPIEQSGNTIRIRPIDSGQQYYAYVSYTVNVPPNSSIVSRSSSHEQRITGIQGRLRVTSGSGNIMLADVANASAESTENGQIIGQRIKGTVTAKTRNGKIELDGEPLGPWEIQTTSGPVVVQLTPNAAFELDSRADAAAVTVNHPIMVRKKSKNEIAGTAGRGGPQVFIRTASGKIRVD